MTASELIPIIISAMTVIYTIWRTSPERRKLSNESEKIEVETTRTSHDSQQELLKSYNYLLQYRLNSDREIHSLREEQSRTSITMNQLRHEFEGMKATLAENAQRLEVERSLRAHLEAELSRERFIRVENEIKLKNFISSSIKNESKEPNDEPRNRTDVEGVGNRANERGDYPYTDTDIHGD